MKHFSNFQKSKFAQWKETERNISDTPLKTFEKKFKWKFFNWEVGWTRNIDIKAPESKKWGKMDTPRVWKEKFNFA